MEDPTARVRADFDNLVETLEILSRAIRGKDTEKGMEAITVFLLQFMQVFGHDEAIMRSSLPMLERLKNDIQNRSFEGAMAMTLSWLAHLREARSRACH